MSLNTPATDVGSLRFSTVSSQPPETPPRAVVLGRVRSALKNNVSVSFAAPAPGLVGSNSYATIRTVFPLVEPPWPTATIVLRSGS